MEPNRLRGYYGVARAAELAGRADLARAACDRLLELTSRADGDLPELAQARAFVTRP